MVTKIIAHRGAKKRAPENTLPAFDLAYRVEADMIELDVQLTKDQVPVIMHDENVKRTTNGNGNISELTYRELQTLDAGAWYSKAFQETKILSLATFLEWIKPKPLQLNIELKNKKVKYKHIETIVYELIQQYQLVDRTIISSFNHKSIKKLHERYPDIRTAILVSKRGRNIVQQAKKTGVNAVHIKYKLLNQRLVEKCHEQGLKVRVYTVNSPNRMKNCFALQCDGIMTDVPEKALKYRKSFMDKINHRYPQDLWIGKAPK